MGQFLCRMILLSVLTTFFVTACGGSKSSISVLPSMEEFQQHTNADVKIDILFVVDDSGSMSQEQQDLYDNFRDFIGLFYDKGFDFRVAVAKTSAYGNTIACKHKTTGSTYTCQNLTTGSRPYYKKDGSGNYIASDYIARESGLTPKEFRCGKGNNCGLNQEYQVSTSIPDTDGDDELGTETLTTTVGNGTPGVGTDHILASSNLTRNQMIDKFKKNILVGLAGSGDERGIESAETVIRHMKNFYNTPETQFPRPGSHLAIIHVGDEGDGPIPNAGETALHGSNRSGSSPYITSTWGSLRSSAINGFANPSPFPAAPTITLINSSNQLSLNAHLDSVDSYLDALKAHEPTTTVSVHSIEDLPNLANRVSFLPDSAYDSCGSTNLGQTGNGIGFFQSYMASQTEGGLVLSKCNNFGPMLSQLGDSISSLASFFQLSERLDQLGQDTLKVYVQGINGNNPIPKSDVNGYQYDSVASRIRFYGSMIPPQGAIIGVIYTCATLTCPAL